MVSKRAKKKEERKGRERSIAKPSRSDNGDGGEWPKCPVCGVIVKSKNLSSHIKRVHGEVSEEKRKQIKKASKTKGKNLGETLARKESDSRRQRREGIIIFSVVIILISSVVGGYFVYERYSQPDEGEGDKSDDLPPIIDPPSNDGTSPTYYLGAGENNWWVDYPIKHPDRGKPVNHLEWIKQDLGKKAVLIVIHKTGCGPCTPQSIRAGELGEKYSNDLIFHDLDLVDGSSTYDRGMETFMYDPDDAQSYIALTVVLTLITDDSGKVSIAWHSWEGDMDKSELESWVIDGINHYKQI